MNRYDTYIFDLDGTLLDTLGDLAAATNYALRQHQLPEHPIDDIRRFVGNGVRMLIARAVPGGESHPLFEQVLNTFRTYYLEHSLDTTRPYPGIPDMLERLKLRGARMAVVSNKFQTATAELCEHFFPDTIQVAIGEDEAAGIRKKPAPDTVIKALHQLGVSSEDQSSAVYVGDSDVDIQTARNSHLPCISVLWGFRDREFLIAHGAETFVASPQEL